MAKNMSVEEFDMRHKQLEVALINGEITPMEFVDMFNALMDEFQSGRDDGITYPREYI